MSRPGPLNRSYGRPPCGSCPRPALPSTAASAVTTSATAPVWPGRRRTAGSSPPDATGRWRAPSSTTATQPLLRTTAAGLPAAAGEHPLRRGQRRGGVGARAGAPVPARARGLHRADRAHQDHRGDRQGRRLGGLYLPRSAGGPHAGCRQPIGERTNRRTCEPCPPTDAGARSLAWPHPLRHARVGPTWAPRGRPKHRPDGAGGRRTGAARRRPHTDCPRPPRGRRTTPARCCLDPHRHRPPRRLPPPSTASSCSTASSSPPPSRDW